jgi:penicillin-binding protein 1C
MSTAADSAFPSMGEAAPRHWRRRLRVAAALVCFVTVALLGGSAWWVYSLGPAPLGHKLKYSKLVVDRHGKLLRAYTTSEGRWRLPIKVRDVDSRFFKVLFA